LKYKLIAIDLDGTLLNDEKQITPENEKAIENALNKDYKVTICTGRSLQSAKDYLEKIPKDIPVVLQNGALIVKDSGRDILVQRKLSKQLSLEIIETLKNEFDLLVFRSFFEIPDIFFERISNNNPYTQYFKNNQWRMKKVEKLEDVVDDNVVEVAILGEKKTVERSLETQRFGSDVSKIVSGIVNDWVFCELFNKKVSKEKAIEFLADYYGIDLSEIVFIGDNYNDLEVMKIVGMPIAMGNSPEDIKKAAKFVVLSNIESGVAVALEKIIKNEV